MGAKITIDSLVMDVSKIVFYNGRVYALLDSDFEVPVGVSLHDYNRFGSASPVFLRNNYFDMPPQVVRRMLSRSVYVRDDVKALLEYFSSPVVDFDDFYSATS